MAVVVLVPHEELAAPHFPRARRGTVSCTMSIAFSAEAASTSQPAWVSPIRATVKVSVVSAVTGLPSGSDTRRPEVMPKGRRG